jgi:RNase P subunit RPR2
MPSGRLTPKYKFRLLCRRCNSYLHTSLEATPDSLMPFVLHCSHCGNHAHDLDEAEERP